MRQRMEPRTLLDFMGVAERLKCNMRHSRTAENRRESVAEHTYRLCVFAWLVKEEFPDCDMDKVMRMSLFDELEKAETMEAKIVHALDKMEALIQHNEADIATWLPLEYDLQMTYGEKECKADPYLAKLREVIRRISADKIASEGEERGQSYYIRKGVENMHLEEVAALLHSTDWAKDRTEELIRKSMENACPYGLFLSDCISEGEKDRQIGFARVLTDGVTTFYLMDLVIEEAYRGQGFGTIMMNQIMKENGHLYGMLHTQTAKAFYERYGFREIGNTKKTEEIYMEKPCG